jgi:peptidoglycan/xylan/chitin deacetylase (PgdA/CDA1 family)
MPRYIAAYDTETTHCYTACGRIVEVHREFDMPATFFIVGQWLQERPQAYRELLDDPLFEIASHTWSHGLLKDNPYGGEALHGESLAREIRDGKRLIEDLFERPCLGLRTPFGFDDGMRGAPEALRLISQAGYRYVSSLGWGPDFTLPAPLHQPFNYAAEGHPDLWELPGHGWHENIIKNHSPLGRPIRVAWPIERPERIPPGYLRTPAQEASLHRVFLEAAIRQNLSFVSLIWHPWSLGRFDPEMKMLRELFSYVRQSGLRPDTYAGLYADIVRC